MTPLHQLAIFAVSAAVFLALGLLAVGGVAFALACIGTEDQDELRPVTVTMAWLRRVRDRIGQALSGEDDLAEDGEQCPGCLRFTYDPHAGSCWNCGWQLRDEQEDGDDEDVLACTGRAEVAAPADLPVLPGPVPAAAEVGTEREDADSGDVALSDFDTDTLRIFREAREEHLVPTNEPEPPATAQAANPPAADGGESPAGESTAGDASGAVEPLPPAPEATTEDDPRPGRARPGRAPGVHPDGLGELVEMTVTDPPGPVELPVMGGERFPLPQPSAGPGVRRWVAEFLAADDADVDAEWLGWMAARLRAVTAHA